MKNIFRSFFLLVLTTVIFPAAAQNDPGHSKEVVPLTDDPVYTFVEEMPEFPGGSQALAQYMAANIKYPVVAMRNGLEGLVVLSFVVNQVGIIEDIKVLKRLGGGTDEEAIRVVKAMPKWKPGKQNGKTVKTRFTLPVRFAITEAEPAE